jgi:carbon-monoxide dehydrogenase medium subunit
MFATALEEGEIVVRVRFSIPRRAAYEKFPHPASGYAMAGVFVADSAAGLRVAVTGAASGVFRWKEAEQALTKKLDADALENVPLDTADMNEDIHATREYRANLARVMAKRALKRMLA